MAKSKKPAPNKNKTRFPNVGSKEYFDSLRTNYGVSEGLPPGTSYITGSNNLNYGIGAAYDANDQFLGFVRANIGEGYKAYYNPATGAPLSITGPGDAPPPPAAPPPPKFSFDNIPEDEQYRLDREARRGALQTSLAGYEAGENAASSDYGIGFDRYASDVTDAQGRLIARTGDVNFSTLRMPSQSQYDADRGFDTANPFSRASLLNQSFTTNRKMSMGGYANRGLLTSGAYGRAQYRDADRYNRGASDLQKEFASRLGEYRAQRGQAYSNYDSSNIDDRRQLVERALRQFQLNNPSA